MEITAANIQFSTINELADLIRQKFTPNQRAELVELIQKSEPEEEDELTKEQLIEEIREAVREVNLMKKGKLKSRPLKELLDEL